MKVAAAPARRAAPERFDRVRGEILARAAAAFRAHGFHGAGMREIAAAAGMQVGNLYHYFPAGKADLLYACQRTALDTLLAGAKEVEARGGPAPARLEELVVRHVRCLLETTGGSAAHLEFRALPEPHRAVVARRRRLYEAAVRRTVEDGVARGELRCADPKLAALAVLGALNATVTWWRPDGDRSPDEIGKAFAKTLVGGLLP